MEVLTDYKPEPTLMNTTNNGMRTQSAIIREAVLKCALTREPSEIAASISDAVKEITGSIKKAFRYERHLDGAVIVNNETGRVIRQCFADNQSGCGGFEFRREKARKIAKNITKHMNQLAADPNYGVEYAQNKYAGTH